MTVLISTLAFVLLLTLLILIHEWGHFAAARKFGVVVEEFGFGLPPKLKTLFKQGGTNFTVNWIPFGGFVRLKGENAMSEKARRAKGSFGAAPIYGRVIILLAGVFMNLVLALVILTAGFTAGWIPTYLTYDEMREAGDRGEISVNFTVLIDSVVGGSNAAVSGIPGQSVIRSIDGQKVSFPDEIHTVQEGKQRVTYVVSRIEDGKVLEETERYSVALTDGKAGVVIVPYPTDLSAPKRGVGTAFMLAIRESRVMTSQTVIGIGKLFTSLASSGKVPEGISGIIGIAQLTHGAVQEGLTHYLRLVALLSLSLAVLNVLPFPALDGGRLLFVLAEGITRRPVNRTFEVTTNAIGFIVLILLILLITFNDIVRLF